MSFNKGKLLLSETVTRWSILLVLLSFVFYQLLLTYSNFDTLRGIYIALSCLMLVSPFLIAATAYNSSSLTAQGELHELLMLTSITDSTIVRIYIRRTFQKMQIIVLAGMVIVSFVL